MYTFKVYKGMLGILILLMVIFNASIANASWAWLSAKELAEKSDVIIIGEVIGKTGTKKIDQLHEIMWQVRVKYYLKGDIKDEYITVITPPMNVSTHYNLNEWGKEVLLLLYKKVDVYSPFSPQAVIPISVDNEILKNSKSVSGEELLKGIKINDSKADAQFKSDIEDIIKESSVTAVDSSVKQKKDSSVFVYSVLLLGIGTLLVIIKVKKKSRV